MTDEPQLKYEDARVIDCRDLDKFVNMHLEGYGLRWCVMDTNPTYGYNNDSFVQCEVTFGDFIEDDEDQDFNRWLLNDGPFYLDEEDATYHFTLPGIENMLQWLCNTGKIADGRYVVKIWW